MGFLKEFVYRLRGDHTTEWLIAHGLTVGNNFKRLIGATIDPSHCWLIDIGDNVTLAPRVSLIAHDASMWTALGYTRIAPIHIGNRVFIGENSVVLPGVTIGDDVIIGANSTVTHDVPSGRVFAGNPARLVNKTNTFIEKNQLKMQQSPCYGEEYTLRKNISLSLMKQMKSDLQDACGYVK